MIIIQHRRRRFLRAIVPLFFLYSIFESHYISYQIAHTDPTIPTLPTSQPLRIFIAAIHWNSEFTLRTYWNQAVIGLAHAFGPENVFVSIYESGNYDGTKDALRELDRSLEGLSLRRNITLSNVTHQDDPMAPSRGEGWIETGRGKGLRRIPYLSPLRNLSIQPLKELAREGVFFDKVLFLNDVVFRTEDVVELLTTNDGRYGAACSLDFSNPPFFYDTFALRDILGSGYVTPTWPYFRSWTSRNAIKTLRPVPVMSCWNGIVAMPATPFIRNNLSFRGIPDSLAQSHLEGSECCLIHADNPHSVDGVFLNPKVRVGYDGAAYEQVHPAGKWLSTWLILRGLWENLIRRWSNTSIIKQWMIDRRIKNWEEGSGMQEPWKHCVVDETQVLLSAGWAHV